MKNKNNISESYEGWLVDYQEDLHKIIGKYHLPYSHAITHDDVLSQVNLRLIQDKDKLIESKVVEDFSSFKKIAYSYTRNNIKWTADGVTAKDKKYFAGKNDSVVNAEEGTTAFDLLCDTLGAEDPTFTKLNKPEKIKNIQKWILDYSHFLSDRQKNILTFVLKGSRLIDIGEAMGITHQAISHAMGEIIEKISHYINPKTFTESERKVIKKGRESINYLFGPERKKYRSQFNTMAKKCT